MLHNPEVLQPVVLPTMGDGRRVPELVIFDCDRVLIDSEIDVCRLTAGDLASASARQDTALLVYANR